MRLLQNQTEGNIDVHISLGINFRTKVDQCPQTCYTILLQILYISFQIRAKFVKSSKIKYQTEYSNYITTCKSRKIKIKS